MYKYQNLPVEEFLIFKQILSISIHFVPFALFLVPEPYAKL